jgi:hypothetical protein
VQCCKLAPYVRKLANTSTTQAYPYPLAGLLAGLGLATCRVNFHVLVHCKHTLDQGRLTWRLFSVLNHSVGCLKSVLVDKSTVELYSELEGLQAPYYGSDIEFPCQKARSWYDYNLLEFLFETHP